MPRHPKRPLETRPHDAGLWQRLENLIRVEAPAFAGDPPLTWGRIWRLCRDVNTADVDRTVQEMRRAGVIKRVYDWDADLEATETYIYSKFG